MLTSNDFLQLGVDLIGLRNHNRDNLRPFKSSFGVEPLYVALIWRKFVDNGTTERAGIRKAKPVHLLWTLLWLRTYNTIDHLSAMCTVTPKTFREKVWFYAASIARLSSEYVS